jgi:hypothetical protein
MERCDDCGEAFVFSVGLDEHRERCTGSPGDVVDGSYGDGTCPMCGLEYGKQSYLQHLASCDGSEGGGSTTATEPPAEPAPTEVASHETDGPTWK